MDVEYSMRQQGDPLPSFVTVTISQFLHPLRAAEFTFAHVADIMSLISAASSSQLSFTVSGTHSGFWKQELC